MPLTHAEFARFQSFAAAKLAYGGTESLQELVDLWYAEALDEGLAVARAGRTRPAREFFEELVDCCGVTCQ